MAVVTRLNGKGVAELLKSNDVRDYLTELAERVLSEAKANAPEVTGDYARGLRIETAMHPTRVVVQVRGSTDYDWFVEANHGTLARALDAAGVGR